MTMTIHRCAECNHQSADHGSVAGGYGHRVGPCSYGGCICQLTPTEVTDRNPAVEIPTFPLTLPPSGAWFKRAGS